MRICPEDQSISSLKKEHKRLGFTRPYPSRLSKPEVCQSNAMVVSRCKSPVLKGWGGQDLQEASDRDCDSKVTDTLVRSDVKYVACLRLM